MRAALVQPVADHRTRGAALQVDVTAIAHNTRLLAERAGGALMAVVKADGFGHGATRVAQTALRNGASCIGVTSVAEAVALRADGITAPILSWLNPLDGDFAGALRHDVDLAVPSREHLAAIVDAATRACRPARLHLQLDVGMARDGAAPMAWARLCQEARRAEQAGTVRVVGLMGHLACADEPDHPANARARDRFTWGLAIARRHGLQPPLRHLAATSATLTDPLSHHTLCRVGAGLVGIDPSRTSDALRWAMTLTAPVVSVREVIPGTQVGYGHTWTADRSTRLALLPLGYADGLPRCATGAGVQVRGRRCPIVGRISMDQVVVDVGSLPVAVGEVATIFGSGEAGEPTVADWATWAGTIEHEIVTGIGPRVLR